MHTIILKDRYNHIINQFGNKKCEEKKDISYIYEKTMFETERVSLLQQKQQKVLWYL